MIFDLKTPMGLMVWGQYLHGTWISAGLPWPGTKTNGVNCRTIDVLFA